MEVLDYIILGLAGFVASFMGVIVGGGGLITLPLMLFMGIPVHTAIASNRMGSLGLFASGAYKFQKGGVVNKKIAYTLIPIGLVGSFLGANLLLAVSEELVKKILGLFLILVILLVIFQKDFGLKDRVKQKSLLSKTFGYIFIFFVAIYGGFMSAGGGVFAIYILVSLLGLNFLGASGTTKLSALTSAIIALLVFILHDKVDYLLGTVLIISYALGAWFGSSFALKKGSKWIKRLYVMVVIVFAVKLLFF